MDEEKPAKIFPFELDPFQKDAIALLHRSTNLFAAAHTSAGKTAIAEYAIALALARSQRVIYTSPIKALSNQKFNEFSHEFGDVGLVTGDTAINSDASVLVCTTEILRNMLYKGDAKLTEVAFVVFDEVHYMRDRERGTVWEESIVLLDANITLVFLSATLSNADEFAAWVAWLKKRPCEVVSTEKRPVPLEHVLFLRGKSPFTPLTKERFVGPPLTAIMQNAKASALALSGELRVCLQTLLERKEDPVIVFCFSRNDCDTLANSIAGASKCGQAWTTEEEQLLIGQIFNNAIASLATTDQQLASVRSLLPLLSLGVGLHHSGLIPVLKEVVELLFAENLLKVLFATETFAMGVNMPARSVVFLALTKFDGEGVRALQPSEYTQMSGRAGRRGKDERGLVVVLGKGVCTQELFGVQTRERKTRTLQQTHTSPEGLKKKVLEIVAGKAAPLESSFRLNFNMVLNLTRMARKEPLEIVQKSFKQFQDEQRIKSAQKDIGKLQNQLAELEADKNFPGWLEAFCLVFEALDSYGKSKAGIGSLALFKHYGFALVLRTRVRFVGGGIVYDCLLFNDKAAVCPEDVLQDFHSFVYYFCKLRKLLRVDEKKLLRQATANAERPNDQVVCVVEPENLKLLVLSEELLLATVPRDTQKKLNLQLAKKNLLDKQNLSALGGLFLAHLVLSFPLSLLNERTATKLKKLDKLNTYTKTASVPLQTRTAAHLESWAFLQRALRERADTQMTRFSEELVGKQNLLKHLGYITGETKVAQKGLVASEISVGDELLLTECFFEGLFSGLTDPQTVALAAMCINEVYRVRHNLKAASALLLKLEQSNRVILERFGKVLEIRDRLLVLKKKFRANNENEQETESVARDKELSSCYTIGALTFAWATGLDFGKSTELCGFFAGTSVRILKRVEELLNEMIPAAEKLGSNQVQKSLENGLRLLKRGIVFAGSLYT